LTGQEKLSFWELFSDTLPEFRYSDRPALTKKQSTPKIADRQLSSGQARQDGFLKSVHGLFTIFLKR